MANPIEVFKTAKDGLDVLPDLYRYAEMDDPQYDEGDLERLKWYGLFHRRATPGFFMLRMRIPNGILTTEQLAAIGDISNTYGRGQADLTTRQNIQLRWIRIQDAPRVLQRLSAVNLTSQQSGMDNVRNLVGCPLAGLHHDELIDASALTRRIQQAIIGLPRFSNLPRKFNLSITGCPDDCTHAQTHDLSFSPAIRDGVVGFSVLVGGAMGGKDPMLAIPLDAFAAPDDVVDVVCGVLSVYRDNGPRASRKLSRLKILLRDWGIERFRAALEAELGRDLPRAGTAASALEGGDHLGVTSQRGSDLVSVGLLVPVGRITGDDLIELSRLARVHGKAEIRLTVQQNVLITHISPDALPKLLEEPLLAKFSPNPSGFLRGLVSCTGMDFCHFSLIDTKGEALELARALDERYEALERVRIHWSGCPHSCAQQKVADVGLEAARVRIDNEIVGAAAVVSGGRLGADAALAEHAAPKTPTPDLPEIVAAQIIATLGPDSIRRRQPALGSHVSTGLAAG